MLICETINVCNANCVFCPYSQQTRRHGLMSLDLFRKIVAEYGGMGGGYFSLTPMVGDVLLDRDLLLRLRVLADAQSPISTSFTTNLFALDHFNDEELQALLQQLGRIDVSIYGTSREECQMLTRKDHFDKFLFNMRRLVSLWERSTQTCEIVMGFRLAFDQSQEQLQAWAEQNFGRSFPFGSTSTYANWGNSMSGALPGKARWVESRENSTTCVLLPLALMIYWDGRVSACACCDYDASDELFLGNVANESLTEIFNGARNRRVWQDHEEEKLPGICKKCTFHIPLSTVGKDHPIVGKVTDFIGG